MLYVLIRCDRQLTQPNSEFVMHLSHAKIGVRSLFRGNIPFVSSMEWLH